MPSYNRQSEGYTRPQVGGKKTAKQPTTEEELNRKIDDLTVSNERYKAQLAQLEKENNSLKNDRNLKEMEAEKLTQYWTITKSQLKEQQEKSVELEVKMHKMKTVHVEQVSLLHKRICMLQLDGSTQRVSATQTDFQDSTEADWSKIVNAETQTQEDWSLQRAHDLVRSNDEQLVELIAEIENAKLQAQSDFKFAVVQMEQRLREEYEAELRQVKEEKERQLEEIVRLQYDQLTAAEDEKNQIKAESTDELTKQRTEVFRLREVLSEKETENSRISGENTSLSRELSGLKEHHEALTKKYQAAKVDQKTIKRDGETIANLRRRLEKIEEINEILLGEYYKLEKERNSMADMIDHLSHVRKAPGQNHTERAREFSERIDDIRRQFGGMQL
ncbi:Protein C47E8.6 [Aphelenchoides avenae]|nr:Protein C47E8.6 [Aphelenchus avenae]